MLACVALRLPRFTPHRCCRGRFRYDADVNSPRCDLSPPAPPFVTAPRQAIPLEGTLAGGAVLRCGVVAVADVAADAGFNADLEVGWGVVLG